jgi:anti-anti-sigma regulatory factor
MIQAAIEKVKSGESEVILDFSAVRRIDTNMVGALQDLARLAGSTSVKVLLRAVNTDIYRVLKQLKLTQRFTFVT